MKLRPGLPAQGQISSQWQANGLVKPKPRCRNLGRSVWQKSEHTKSEHTNIRLSTISQAGTSLTQEE